MNTNRLSLIFLSFLILVNSLVYAKDMSRGRVKRRLDTVSFSLSEQMWLKTKSAKLNVNINATLTNQNLATIRQKLLADLKQIAETDWHITGFNRSEDRSGMAKLVATASTRVMQNKLSKVYQQAKTLSKAGLQYTISSIDFTPSFNEKHEAKGSLRQKIYKAVNDEISVLNTVYPEQLYSVHKIIFNDALVAMQSYRSNESKRLPLMMLSKSNGASLPQTSYQLQSQAFVILASNRKKT